MTQPSCRSAPYRNAADGQSVAFQVIGWIVSDESRAERFLSMTGLDPDQLRSRLGELDVLCAALDFLLGHEPDLLACAEAIGQKPAAIVAARHALGGMPEA